MRVKSDTATDLEDIQRRLRNLSPDRLRVASDFVSYLEERESNEATEELLRISGLESLFSEAVRDLETEGSVRFEDIRRDL